LIQAEYLLTGNIGSSVKLKILRRGKTEPLEMSVSRDQVKIPPVKTNVLESKIGYLKIYRFTPGVSEEIRTKLQHLIKGGATKIILDLRHCAGDEYEEGVKVANLFLDHGVIAYTQGQKSPKREFVADPVIIVILNTAAGAKPIDDPAGRLAALTRLGLVPQRDTAEPDTFRLIVPESLLNFELGRSALTASADQFLREVIPVYARTVCGALRDRVAGVVIEGYTDDLGGDAMNLRLSQERSFRVLVRGLDVLRASAPADHDCFAALASASGRGKQDLIYDAARRPDREASRRVVFKLLFRPAPAG
jgi:outer membrane protein OmpA-like peptidoglycan-associated protein